MKTYFTGSADRSTDTESGAGIAADIPSLDQPMQGTPLGSRLRTLVLSALLPALAGAPGEAAQDDPVFPSTTPKTPNPNNKPAASPEVKAAFKAGYDKGRSEGIKLGQLGYLHEEISLQVKLIDAIMQRDDNSGMQDRWNESLKGINKRLLEIGSLLNEEPGSTRPESVDLEKQLERLKSDRLLLATLTDALLKPSAVAGRGPLQVPDRIEVNMTNGIAWDLYEPVSPLLKARLRDTVDAILAGESPKKVLTPSDESMKNVKDFMKQTKKGLLDDAHRIRAEEGARQKGDR